MRFLGRGVAHGWISGPFFLHRAALGGNHLLLCRAHRGCKAESCWQGSAPGQLCRRVVGCRRWWGEGSPVPGHMDGQERETCFCQGCCLACCCCCWHSDADWETQAASLLSPCMPQPQRRQGLDTRLPALSPCGDDWCGHFFPRAAFLALPGLEKELFAFLDTIQPRCNSPNYCSSITLRCNIWDYCYKVLKDPLFKKRKAKKSQGALLSQANTFSQTGSYCVFQQKDITTEQLSKSFPQRYQMPLA